MRLFDSGEFEIYSRPEKSWDGELMKKGKKAEEIVIDWLKNLKGQVINVIDFREWRLTRRLDVDCGIETINKNIILAEIKSDIHLGKSNNFLFEFMRINHFVLADSIFYLGWAFRSPAKYLLYYSPYENSVYRFEFGNIRSQIGRYISSCHPKSKPRIDVIFTDKQKTTFNLLIPKEFFEGLYNKYNLNK